MINREDLVLTLSAVRKLYGDLPAVDGISLDVEEGDFFCIIGPSGAGKSTLLRMMAGIEPLTAGSILYKGTPVSVSNPSCRDIVLVWQSLALFPHMDVADNVGFGLRVRGMKKAERQERVASALSMVALGGYQRRRIDELSGGEQQRIALARALVVCPRVLLLDEPFGSLDPYRRGELQVVLTKLHRETGITFVMVTHDQSEALTLASRLAVMNAGRIEQIGKSETILAQPATQFVARFVGNKNVYDGVVDAIMDGGIYAVRTGLGVFRAVAKPEISFQLAQGSKVAYVIPADQIVEGNIYANATKGTFLGRVILGSSQIIRLAVADGCILSYELCRDGRTSARQTSDGADRTVSWPDTAAYLLAR